MPPSDEFTQEYYPEQGYSGDCLALTEQVLAVTHKNHRYLLPVTQIQHLELTHIRLMFYYLTGGFTVVLSLLAILNNLLAPLPGILFILVGSTAFFIGWKGKISLRISTTTDDYVFWFTGAFPPFLQFVNLVRQQLLVQALTRATPAAFNPGETDYPASAAV